MAAHHAAEVGDRGAAAPALPRRAPGSVAARHCGRRRRCLIAVFPPPTAGYEPTRKRSTSQSPRNNGFWVQRWFHSDARIRVGPRPHHRRRWGGRLSRRCRRFLRQCRDPRPGRPTMDLGRGLRRSRRRRARPKRRRRRRPHGRRWGVRVLLARGARGAGGRGERPAADLTEGGPAAGSSESISPKAPACQPRGGGGGGKRGYLGTIRNLGSRPSSRHRAPQPAPPASTGPAVGLSGPCPRRATAAASWAAAAGQTDSRGSCFGPAAVTAATAAAAARTAAATMGRLHRLSPLAIPPPAAPLSGSVSSSSSSPATPQSPASPAPAPAAAARGVLGAARSAMRRLAARPGLLCGRASPPEAVGA